MNIKKSGDIKYSKTDDLNEGEKTDSKIDLSPFIGHWSNTKEDSGQLPYVELRGDNGILYLKAFAAHDDGLMEWKEVPCEVFAENTFDGTAIAFITNCALDDIDVEITANVKLGVLVVQTYTKFKDGSNRLNYYAREFYGPSQA